VVYVSVLVSHRCFDAVDWYPACENRGAVISRASLMGTQLNMI